MPISAASSGGYEFYYQLAGSYYKGHAFFQVGSHTINFIGDGDVDYLVVAGGGSGATGTSLNRNAGGGAGGFRTGTLGVSSGNKTVIVGDGGVPNSNGQDSTFDSITSAGGGRGGTQSANGINGGSGGGGGGATNIVKAGGLGNVPATDPPQGNDGSTNNYGFPFTGGCGGGAGSVGLQTGGGSGLPSNITGIERYYAGGGGAQGYSSTPARPGGVGGGGNGGQPGSPYTGGGGGGGQRGGSGIVVIRYQITEEEYNANYQQAPYILSQPEPITTLEGRSYTLSIDAVDYPSDFPSIQWQVSTDSGQSWSDISGATNLNYTATAQFSDNGNLYRGFLSGINGVNTYSEIVRLDVYTYPVITLHPSNIETNPGSVTFTSNATSYPSSPTVQWQISINGGSTWTNIAGATSPNYTKSITTDDDASKYRAVWTNIDGITISNVATLSVFGPPTILTNLEDVSYIKDQTITLNCIARGYPVPVGQWEQSTDNGSTWQNVTGTATTTNGTTTYTYSPGVGSELTDRFKYRVVLTNSSGSVTSNIATLEFCYLENVIVGNVISSGAGSGSGFRMRAGNKAVVAINRGGRGISGLYKANSNQTVSVSPTATFSVSYDSYPEPNIQWQTSLDGITWNDISGANSTTYTKQVQSSDNNTFYRASITNPGMPFDYLQRSVVNSQTATLILSDSNWAYADTGGTITTFSQNGSNWRCHTFDTSGSHSINFTSDGLVEYLIVGGGGGGSVVYFRSWGYHFMAGGGAGGYRTGFTSVSTGSLSVIVGNGGAVSISGSASSFADIESAGGGQGGSHSSGYSFTGTAGGSGGGSARGGGTGAAGNTPAVIPPQGNKGGNGGLSGGGGGGAGGAGQSYVNPEAGPGRYGGLGLASDITGNIVIRATGGSAGDRSLNTAEPGNGGRGNGQTGFDGQVVIRYKI